MNGEKGDAPGSDGGLRISGKRLIVSLTISVGVRKRRRDNVNSHLGYGVGHGDGKKRIRRKEC